MKFLAYCDLGGRSLISVVLSFIFLFKMFHKKSKSMSKFRVNRKKALLNLCQKTRPGPYCVVCRKGFSNSFLFEEHLKTQEHKMVDSPLEFILQRIAEPANPRRPIEYENLRVQVALSESGQLRGDQEGIDLSGLAIGIDCVSSVQVTFCRVCNIFVPEDGHPDVFRRHSLTPQHVSLVNAS